MTIKHTLLLCFFCSLILCLNAQAQGFKPPKVKKPTVTISAATKKSSAYQAALQHVQAMQELKQKGAQVSLPAAGVEPGQSPRAVRVQYAPRRPRKSVQQWMHEMEEFVLKNQRFPSVLVPEEAPLYRGVYNILRLKRVDPAITLRIYELRQKYAPQLPPPQGTSPQEWLDQLEEFVAKNQRFPSRYSQDLQEARLYHGVSWVWRYYLDDNPIVMRMRELRKQYPYIRQISHGKTPQEWMPLLEEFVAQNDRFPSGHAKDAQEVELYRAAMGLARRLSPSDPIADRIRQLRAKYPTQATLTPQEWLEKIEEFVAQNGRLPRPSIAEEKPLYQAISNILHRDDSVDEAVLSRILELREQYPTKFRKAEQE